MDHEAVEQAVCTAVTATVAALQESIRRDRPEDGAHWAAALRDAASAYEYVREAGDS
jgi:hypothetical protein